mmetsp:Transcript_20168/g.48117  ORF Transcript_20168/g.48117 Transcript_20168/m.48117 type:complete len:339 (+) Transcript_20168:773-1789(+)
MRIPLETRVCGPSALALLVAMLRVFGKGYARCDDHQHQAEHADLSPAAVEDLRETKVEATKGAPNALLVHHLLDDDVDEEEEHQRREHQCEHPQPLEVRGAVVFEAEVQHCEEGQLQGVEALHNEEAALHPRPLHIQHFDQHGVLEQCGRAVGGNDRQRRRPNVLHLERVGKELLDVVVHSHATVVDRLGVPEQAVKEILYQVRCLVTQHVDQIRVCFPELHAPVVVRLAVGADSEQVLQHVSPYVELPVANRPVEGAHDGAVDVDGGEPPYALPARRTLQRFLQLGEVSVDERDGDHVGSDVEVTAHTPCTPRPVSFPGILGGFVPLLSEKALDHFH